MATKKKVKLELEDPSAPKDEEIDPIIESDAEDEDPSDDEMDTLEYEGKQDALKAEYDAQLKVVEKHNKITADLLVEKDKIQVKCNEAIAARDGETRKLNSMDGAKISNAQNIRHYLDSQNKLRQERAQEKENLKKALGVKNVPGGPAGSPLDQALGAKPKRGTGRPSRTPFNKG